MKLRRNWSWRQKPVSNGNKFECVIFLLIQSFWRTYFFALIQSVNDLWVYFFKVSYFYKNIHPKKYCCEFLETHLHVKKIIETETVRKYIHLRLCLYQWTHPIPEWGFCFSFRISYEQYMFRLFVYIIFVFSLLLSLTFNRDRSLFHA